MKRGRHARNDLGATLMIVLILITVVSSVMGVILTQVDTSEKTTVMLRDQAANNYGADGATQAVLNALQKSTLNCNDPNNPVGLSLGTKTNPFYQPVSSQQGGIDAYAKCTTDAIQGASTSTVTPPPVTTSVVMTTTSTGSSLGGGDPTLPSYGLLATGTGSGDYGIDFSTSASNRIACIENGSVASKKDINIGSGTTGQYLAVRLSPSVSGSGTTSDCRTGTGTDPATGSKLIVTAARNCVAIAPSYFTPTPCTSGASPISNPAAPSLPSPISATNPAPVCKNVGSTTYAAYVPGLYTNVGLLNAPIVIHVHDHREDARRVAFAGRVLLQLHHRRVTMDLAEHSDRRDADRQHR